MFGIPFSFPLICKVDYVATGILTNLFASPGSEVPVKEQTRGDILN